MGSDREDGEREDWSGFSKVGDVRNREVLEKGSQQGEGAWAAPSSLQIPTALLGDSP